MTRQIDLIARDDIERLDIPAAAMRDICQALDLAKNREPPADTILNSLALGIENSRPAAREMLCVIASNLPMTESTSRMYRVLASSPRAEMRIAAIVCLPEDVGREWAVPILTALATDRSAKVRELAADWALRNWRKDLVSPLREAVWAHPFEDAPKLLRALTLLDIGYSVTRLPAGVDVTLAGPFGMVGGVLDHNEVEGLDDEGIADLYQRKLHGQTARRRLNDAAGDA